MIREDYSKYSNRQIKTKASELQKELPVAAVEPEHEVSESKSGVVVDCFKLNVRSGPSVDSEVICEITASTELMIDEKDSTDDFYKICTAAGVEGFCMKNFIKLLP